MMNSSSTTAPSHSSRTRAKARHTASHVKRGRFPQWLKRPIPAAGQKARVEKQLNSLGLHTVCRQARCPNRGECFSQGTATFLIMGDICSRNCRFCAITSATPRPLDPDEPRHICEAVGRLKLNYVVITSVTRDDLVDGGAAHFAAVVRAVRSTMPDVRIELLVPDFGGSNEALLTVIESAPDVLNHNIETVPRLYGHIRPQANYQRSLELLARGARSGCVTKSGLMVGLGETEEEVYDVLRDIRAAGCSIVTIGQYLQPSDANARVEEFISPEQFERYEAFCRTLGFDEACAGPFVRSSYRAAHVFETMKESQPHNE